MNSHATIEPLADWIKVKRPPICRLVRLHKDRVSGGGSRLEIVGVKDYFQGVFSRLYAGQAVQAIGVGKGLSEFFSIDAQQAHFHLAYATLQHGVDLSIGVVIVANQVAEVGKTVVGDAIET